MPRSGAAPIRRRDRHPRLRHRRRPARWAIRRSPHRPIPGRRRSHRPARRLARPPSARSPGRSRNSTVSATTLTAWRFCLVGGLPLAPFQPAVDRDPAALAGAAADALRRGAEDAHVEVVGLVVVLALGVAARRVAGDPQVAHRRARGQRTQLGVLGQTPDQDNAVDGEAGHAGSPFLELTPHREGYAAFGTVYSIGALRRRSIPSVPHPDGAPRRVRAPRSAPRPRPDRARAPARGAPPAGRDRARQPRSGSAPRHRRSRPGAAAP